MPTLSNLLDSVVSAGRLEPIEIPLDGGGRPNRLLYGTPDFIRWLDEGLRPMTSTLRADDTPLEQVYAMLADYVEGWPINVGRRFKTMRPSEAGVWELRTADVRIFGWFVTKDVFVAAFGNDASFIKDHDLYAGYRDQCARLRGELGLPWIVSGKGCDVVSIRH